MSTARGDLETLFAKESEAIAGFLALAILSLSHIFSLSSSVISLKLTYSRWFDLPTLDNDRETEIVCVTCYSGPYKKELFSVVH